MAANDPMIGRTIAERYRVQARIGRGGFGAVYRATQLGLDRPVALKVMHGDGGDDLIQRFRREARLQASLRHPVCVIVFDYGEDDGDPWLVQEFITGRELKAVLAAEGRLSPERAVAITCRLLEGLAAAHDSGIVHRDIKPSNIMLVREGDREDVRLLDFGIARAMAEEETSLTSPGQVIGTARYIAPEQARGSAPAPASDLYSVGVVLYQMLTGAPPFPAFDMREAVIAHLTLAPPPLPDDVPPKLAAVVAQALAKHPADRPPSAAAMIDRLQAALRPTSEPPPAPLPAPLPTPPPARAPRPRRALLAAALAALVVVAAWAALPDAAGDRPRSTRPSASGPADAARPDTTSPHAALPDAALPDAALPDVALPDAALPDADAADMPPFLPPSVAPRIPALDAQPPAPPPAADPQRRRIARLERDLRRALAECRCDDATVLLDRLAIIAPRTHEAHLAAFVNRCRLLMNESCVRSSVGQ